MSLEHEKYRSLTENMPDGFAIHQIITDTDNRPVDYLFLDVNAPFEKMTGLSKNNIIGKKVTEVLPGIENSSFDWIGTYGNVALNGVTIRFESYSDPLNRWYEVTAYSDKPLYFITIFRDITDRKQAEEALAVAVEELSASDRRKDEFLGALSHEIRNPLASIMMCISLLEQAESGGEKAGKAIDIMSRQVTHLSRLVDDLLDVTRITSNKIMLKKEQVELNDLVRQSIEVYLLMFQKKGLEIVFQPSSSELKVEVDPTRLSQVLGNLLHNSFKFTEGGGSVLVTVSKNELQQNALICIEDNGVGMSREFQKKLFQPFIQADTSLDRSNGGLGLGLALVKGLIELHGGTVSAHSEGSGKGSTFTLRLPLSDELFKPRVVKSGSAVSFRNRRILIIEDIIDLADILRLMLEGEGYEVMVAHNGQEGIEMAKKYRPDILLCDIGLPGMNGYQVARTFCEDEDLRNVYRVSLTGYARPDDKKKAKEAGFHHQLAKPVELEELKKTLTNK